MGHSYNLSVFDGTSGAETKEKTCDINGINTMIKTVLAEAAQIEVTST